LKRKRKGKKGNPIKKEKREFLSLSKSCYKELTEGGGANSFSLKESSLPLTAAPALREKNSIDIRGASIVLGNNRARRKEFRLPKRGPLYSTKSHLYRKGGKRGLKRRIVSRKSFLIR